MSQVLEPEESARLNQIIRRWLTAEPEDRDPAAELAVRLGLSRDAFYQRVHRLRSGHANTRRGRPTRRTQ